MRMHVDYLLIKVLSVDSKNMADVERYLQPLEVISFFATHEKSTNHDLIKEFRPLLIPENPFGKENHTYLKKLTANLVIVKKIQGQFRDRIGYPKTWIYGFGILDAFSNLDLCLNFEKSLKMAKYEESS